MNKITENTLIPVSLILVLVSGVTFFANVSFETSSNAKAIAALQEEQDVLAKELVQTQKEISVKLTEIQADIKSLKKEHK